MPHCRHHAWQTRDHNYLEAARSEHLSRLDGTPDRPRANLITQLGVRRIVRHGAQPAGPMTKVISVPALSVTFGTAGNGPWASKLSPMEAIATVTTYAAITCVFALIGIVWRHAECADEAVKLLRRRHSVRD